jgi:ATP-binding cassette subfamily B protein
MKERLVGLRTMTSLLFRADPARAAGAIFLAMVNSAATISHAFWLKVFADAVLQQSRDLALLGIFGYLAVRLIGGVAGWIRAPLVLGLNERVSWLIEQELISITAGVPGLEHFERTDYQKELELLRQQRSRLAGTATAIVSNVDTLVRMTLTLVLLGSLHPALILLPLFAVPSLIIGTKTVGRQERVSEELAETYRGSNHLFELSTTPGPAKELRIFSLGGELIRRHGELWRTISRKRSAVDLRTSGLSVMGWAIFGIGYAGALLLSVLLAIAGRVTGGDVLMAFSLVGQISQQTTAVVGNVTTLLRDLKTVGRYLWLLDYAASARVASIDRLPVPDRIDRGIDISNVSFTYPGTTQPVLRGVDLHIPAGSTMAIVGDNGVGKTTLVKLLCRFYQPTSGTILLDGSDIGRFDHEEWRSRLAAGFQDFMNFEFVARETVGVGDLSRIEDLEFVNRALVRANAEDVVSALPAGLETQLGLSFEGGAELSVGQWQKLALGRAMMRDPLLLVLDEPTSSLDSTTEHALFERFASESRRASLMNGAITILVSHRFSTVRMADLIVVIQEGKIIEQGSHRELVSRGGVYADLYELQASSYR